MSKLVTREPWSEGYTKSDMRKNKRLDQCRICGRDIFYLELRDDTRTWWHERYEVDDEHEAKGVHGG